MAYRLPPPAQPPRKTGRLRKGAILFLIHCPDADRIYAVPVGESGVLTEASLRVTPPANGQTRGIRWAADHELPT